MKKDIDFFKLFRVNLLLLRVSHNLSAIQLSKKIDIPPKRITDFEYGKHGRGKPKSDELFRIAKFFGVTAEDLIYKKATVVLS